MIKYFYISLLILCVISSAVGVVYSKHESRKLFVTLSGLEKQRDDLNIEWGKLQLELSTWATHGRIEKIARKKLKMQEIDYNKTILLRP